jgi:hypothetical protein
MDPRVDFANSWRASGSRLPNLIIVGVSRAGTTSLFSYLAQHPDICASSIKEVKYFTPLKYGKALAPLEVYAQYFAHWRGEIYRMEASPGYFYGGMPLVSTMKEMLPGAHALVLLRDPSARVWSAFNYMKMRSRIDKDLTLDEYVHTALDQCKQDINDLRASDLYWPLATGFYAEYISEWFETFGSEFRVVFFEELAKNPRTVVEEVCVWLNLESDPAAGLKYAVRNRSGVYKHKRLDKIAHAISDRGDGFLRQHPVLKGRLRQIYDLINEDQHAVRFDPAIRRLLDAFYSASNEALASELSARGYRDLPAWLRVRAASASG